MAAAGECSLAVPLSSVSLTHVEYPAVYATTTVADFINMSSSATLPEVDHRVVLEDLDITGENTSLGDFTGYLLAYVSLGPIFIIVGFITLIVFKRELHTISFLLGLLFNEGVNWLIKNIIQEPRPCAEIHPSVHSKYAMPSSHSQFMWFFAIYSFLFLYLRMHQTNNARFLDLLWRHVLSLCLLTVAFLVSYSRVYLRYHTWSQVVYGGLAGTIMAVVWFIFTQEILTPLFPRIAAWPISEFFLIRDTSLIPNILWFEYTVTRAEARNRQRKLGTKLQ